MSFRRTRSRRRDKQELAELLEQIQAAATRVGALGKALEDAAGNLQEQIRTIETDLGGKIGTLRTDVDELKQRRPATP